MSLVAAGGQVRFCFLQKEVADYLGIHYSLINKLLRGDIENTRSKTSPMTV
jgi:hypothetical protein